MKNIFDIIPLQVREELVKFHRPRDYAFLIITSILLIGSFVFF